MIDMKSRITHLFDSDDPFGGVTFAFAEDVSTHDVYVGVAACSEKDQFCRKVGRELAEERLNQLITHGTDVVMKKDSNLVTAFKINKKHLKDVFAKYDLFEHLREFDSIEITGRPYIEGCDENGIIKIPFGGELCIKYDIVDFNIDWKHLDTRSIQIILLNYWCDIMKNFPDAVIPNIILGDNRMIWRKMYVDFC